MKINIRFIALFIALSLCQYAVADELKLKRGCASDNPLAKDVADATLIGIYTQLCDKKNIAQKDAYLVQAAQRFQQLGLNYSAIQIVNELEAKNIKSNALTDVKFLIGVKFANDALAQMRSSESRFLTQELTYPPAQTLTNSIKNALPASVMQQQVAKPNAAVKPVVKTFAVNKSSVNRTKPVVRSKRPIIPAQNPENKPSNSKTPFANL